MEKTNVLTTAKKKKSYAIKIFILSVLVIVNISLYTATQAQTSRWSGTVKIPTRHWSTNTKQFINTLFLDSTFNSIKDDFAAKHHLSLNYDFERIGNNKLLFIKKTEPKSIHRNRAFYLDEKCSLIFSGREKISMYNVTLNCK